MPQSPGSPPSQPAVVAPPREPGGRLHRTGYVILAASGLALATAFGAVAQFSSPSSADDAPPALQANPGGGPGALVPGQPQPGPVMVSGVPVPGTSPSAAPTTIVTTGPDGVPTTTVVTPPPAPPAPGNPPGPGDPPQPPSTPTGKPTTIPPTTSKPTDPPTSDPSPTDPPSSSPQPPDSGDPGSTTP
ncbi:hypothetical protein [Amycolatopsis sp. 195334CR]|uniref:hypothetical protein n=1 Tax=Amycolatopsis sp. 195334CR TaxID=2814588 RepID=UPI001A8DD40B|nr:hypothetical protein [Amycolatopsis sp. 195334CR]MBN6033429.1 hypothetical protein [Amycolatopsis sp. 195334CR]